MPVQPPNALIALNTLAVIGVGLIGGSFAQALRSAGAVKQVIGYDQDLAQINAALEAGVIDQAATSPQQAVQAADVVLIAVPVRALPAVLKAITPGLLPHALVMDVGSTKCDALANAHLLNDLQSQFVPAHPIAGREKSGVYAADAELFRGKHAILTPGELTSAEALQRATALWQQVGAKVLRMTASEHDAIFAAVSHLPHMLAFALVTEFAQRGNANDLFKFAASGFRDFTRIAASSPEMWRDIALNNQQALLAEMKQYQAALAQWVECLERGDGESLARWMAVSKDHRERWGRGDFD